MSRAYISVGSNIDPEKNVKEALRRLAAHIPVTKISTVYHTEPELRPEQPWYYNCVAEIDTDLRPEELKYALLRRIEKQLGRKRTADKFAPRPIDLDLILYDGLTFQSPGFTLPDPDIFEWPYLLAGLQELAKDLKLGGLKPHPAAAQADAQAPQMEPLEDYTRSLRQEIIRDGQK